VGVLRAHVRNLRMKLAQVGLPNAVRSLRGKGYALVV
jgi:DNA-binding response OmpR family regulator